MITKFKNFEKHKSFGKMNLPKDILDIYKIFKANNKEIHICGGAVRDFIIGNEPHDYDLVTNAKPNEIIEILKDKYNLDLQGKQFGVVRVFTKNFSIGIEIASYRKDLTKGRDNKGNNQKVDIETADIYSDAQRRDITSNALYYDINRKEIIDLVGGVDDIKNGIIRAVGEPLERFSEDRLRICRIFRFAARGELKIDKKTSESIKNDNRLRNISSIDDVSQERIVEEFIKAINWSSDNKKLDSLKYYLELLKEYNMFEEMFPKLNINIDNINTFNLNIIFALLFRDNEIEKLRNKLRKYKFSNDIANTVYFLLKLKNNVNELDKIPILYREKIRYHVDNKTISEFFKLYNFDNENLRAFLKFKPKIDANEIIKLGFKGVDIGKEVKKREIEKFKSLLTTVKGR